MLSYAADALAEVTAWRCARRASCVSSARIQHVVHERALAGARHAGHDGDGAERDLDVDAVEVVLARAGERDPARPEAAALVWQRNLTLAA